MDIPTVIRQGRRLRILGIDDGPFDRYKGGNVLVVGAVYSGELFEGLLSTHVRQDGFNATRRLIDMIVGSKFQDQIHMVMLDGITLAGFNVVDLRGLQSAIGRPCIAVMRKHPNRAAIESALSRVSRGAQRQDLMDHAGPIHRSGSLCYQVAGLEPEVASLALGHSVFFGLIPECLRGAHLIASGLVLGESGRRA
jgi:uncharacterized protein